tara:strand:- start:1953 stop:2537 length:585 start_codon:yes stop_codon:yes gene_type:complete
MYNVGFSYFTPVDLYESVESFLISKVKYSRKDSEAYDKDYFFHFRVLSKEKFFNFYPESFFQYEKNNSSLTSLRYLAGIGARYSFYDGFIFGTSILNEWYKEVGSNSKTSVWRLSQYVKATLTLSQFNRINFTCYVQPKVINFSNIRYFGELNLVNQLTQSISYSSSLTMKYFSKSEEFSEVELFFNSGIQVKL